METMSMPYIFSDIPLHLYVCHNMEEKNLSLLLFSSQIHGSTQWILSAKKENRILKCLDTKKTT